MRGSEGRRERGRREEGRRGGEESSINRVSGGDAGEGLSIGFGLRCNCSFLRFLSFFSLSVYDIYHSSTVLCSSSLHLPFPPSSVNLRRVFTQMRKGIQLHLLIYVLVFIHRGVCFIRGY